MKVVTLDSIVAVIRARRGYKGFLHKFIEECEITDAIPIPTGATNGDMIKAMFPNISINETNRGFVLLESENDNVSIWNSWWNAPYKPESEGNND